MESDQSRILGHLQEGNYAEAMALVAASPTYALLWKIYFVGVLAFIYGKVKGDYMRRVGELPAGQRVDVDEVGWREALSQVKYITGEQIKELLDLYKVIKEFNGGGEGDRNDPCTMKAAAQASVAIQAVIASIPREKKKKFLGKCDYEQLAELSGKIRVAHAKYLLRELQRLQRGDSVMGSEEESQSRELRLLIREFGQIIQTTRLRDMLG